MVNHSNPGIFYTHNYSELTTFSNFQIVKLTIMKTLKIFSTLFLLLGLCSFSFAQEKNDTFKVSGECGTCKKKIEKAAKTAGASYASWDMKSKVLVVKYSSVT